MIPTAVAVKQECTEEAASPLPALSGSNTAETKPLEDEAMEGAKVEELELVTDAPRLATLNELPVEVREPEVIPAILSRADFAHRSLS